MRRPILILCCALLLAGCAAVPSPTPGDPLEGLNRDVSRFNHGIDHAALKPAATAYDQDVPELARTGVSNFFGNLSDVWSSVNCLLQLRPGDAAQDAMRFAVNTFFGLAGVLDVASDAGIARHREDFGMTLAHWGVPAGPYVVLPIFGPSTLRDAAALPVDWFADPVNLLFPVPARNTLLAGRAVDTRANLLPLDPVLDQALDPYTFMRDAYLQHRDAQTRKAADARDGLLPEAASAW